MFVKKKNNADSTFNKVICIGGNHRNGLALARIFGIHNIFPIAIIVEPDEKHPYLESSKYWSEVFVVPNEREAINLLATKFANEQLRPVVIPYSDGVAQLIDENLDGFSGKFIIQSINNEQGSISKLMSKQEQYNFAKSHNLPMAETIVYDFSTSLPKNIIFPVILKPVVSAEGIKSDISKCDTQIELEECLDKLRESGRYSRILIQQYLDIDYEILYMGCICSDVSFIASKNIRTWPKIGGSSSFNCVLADDKFKKMGNRLIEALKEVGFCGLFDIEMFVIGENIYLNEINWRNSGRSYMCIGTDVHYPYIWYLSMTGKDTSNLKHFCTDVTQYGMEESIDLRHVFFDGLSLKQWNSDRKRTKCFAFWYTEDFRPAAKRYFQLVLSLIKGKRK